MKIEGLGQPVFLAKPGIELNPAETGSFTHWMENQINEVNTKLNTADLVLNQLASGHAENLHHTMILMEDAKLSFQYMEQIRNRLMSAYQELLRESI